MWSTEVRFLSHIRSSAFFISILLIYVQLCRRNFRIFIQQLKIVLSCTDLVRESMVFIKSNLTTHKHLMYTVTRQQTVEAGQCSRED